MLEGNAWGRSQWLTLDHILGSPFWPHVAGRLSGKAGAGEGERSILWICVPRGGGGKSRGLLLETEEWRAEGLAGVGAEESQVSRLTMCFRPKPQVHGHSQT